MKLLFDQNLSWRLAKQLADLFPDSQHVREAGMKESQDVDIWNYAKEHGFAIVTKDSDFQQRSTIYGFPPKIVYLRIGNCPAAKIEGLVRRYSLVINAFNSDLERSYLALP